MIRKFVDGKIVTFEDDRAPVPGNGEPVEQLVLQTQPEQKYRGQWLPGKNHPTLAADTTGPYAGIVRYLPVPENQIVR